MKKHHLAPAILAAITILTPSVANAAASCSGTVDGIYTNNVGDVIINGSWRTGWTAICNVKQERLGISTEICFTWLAYMTSAVTENKTGQVYYPQEDSGFCATMPTYSSTPAPSYVMVRQ